MTPNHLVAKSAGMNLDQTQRKELTRSVITVGAGRGFLAEIDDGEIAVITAAHCLPFFPPCFAGSYLEKRTYEALLGPLDTQSTVSAECLFADPIADIAVMGQPDSQALGDEADAYRQFVAHASPFPIASASKCGPGLVLSRDGDWVECSIRRYGCVLSIEPAKLVEQGMSGSPILSVKGRAIGVVSIGNGSDQNPVLTDNLPMKFLRQRRR
jgi:hypothetical protein